MNKLSTTAGDLASFFLDLQQQVNSEPLNNAGIHRGYVLYRDPFGNWEAVGNGQSFSAPSRSDIEFMIDEILEEEEPPETPFKDDPNDDGYRPDDALWTPLGWPGNVEEEE